MNSADGNGYLEILIYIIALIVGLALNAYRNYNKRKAKELQQQGGEEPEFPEVLFEPVFDEQEPRYEETEVQEEIKPVPEVDEVNKELTEVVESELAIDKPEKEEGVAAFSSTEQQLISDDINESSIQLSDIYSTITEGEIKIGDYKEPEISDAVEFDLRKAVILSEILNPKYINKYY